MGGVDVHVEALTVTYFYSISDSYREMGHYPTMARQLHRRRRGAAMHDKKNRGFTLVELMIVVAIIGIITAIAIPAFSRYVKRSRMAEVPGYLNKQWAGSVTYYATDLTGEGAAILPRQFPGPAAMWERSDVHDCCEMPGSMCPGGSIVFSTDPVWTALKFSIPDSHYYMPSYSGVDQGTAAKFTAYAQGNLDCDEVVAKFWRNGAVGDNGDVTGAFQPASVNELE
jgi:prepilin-type N-terminal cleavage/methylation domain-containing protein